MISIDSLAELQNIDSELKEIEDLLDESSIKSIFFEK